MMDTLPAELVSHILSFVPPAARVNRVCILFRDLTSSDACWKVVCEREMLELSHKPPCKSWKWYYLSKTQVYGWRYPITGVGRTRCSSFQEPKVMYEGDLVCGRRHGWGRCTLDKESYEGVWVDDQKHGQGKYAWGDGDVYEGDWKAGKQHGVGTYVWANGTKYVGDWKDDYRAGHGTFTWPQGDKYIGGFKESKRHGCGIYTYDDGRFFEGQWVDGERKGEGTYKFPDGTMYVGGWNNSTRCGYGVLTWGCGKSWSGMWDCDLPVGYDGDTESMPWFDFFNHTVDGMCVIVNRHIIRHQVQKIMGRA